MKPLRVILPHTHRFEIALAAVGTALTYAAVFQIEPTWRWYNRDKLNPAYLKGGGWNDPTGGPRP